MLSNKLTFSLILVVLFALVFGSTTVLAQAVQPTVKIEAVDLSMARTAVPDPAPATAVEASITFKLTFSDLMTVSTVSTTNVQYRWLDATMTPIGASAASVSSVTADATDPDTRTIDIAGTATPVAKVFIASLTRGTTAGDTVVGIGSPTSTPYGVVISITAASATVATGRNIGEQADATAADFDLPPVLGDTTVKVTSGTPVLSTASVNFTLTFSAAPDPAPMRTDLMVSPMGATVDAPVVSSDDPMVYTVRVRNIPFGVTALTLSVLPTYASPTAAGDGSHTVRDRVEEDDTDFGKFRVHHSGPLSVTGIDAPDDVLTQRDFSTVDLNDVLRLGGTVEVALKVGPAGSTTHSVVKGGEAGAAYRLIITEVMWGLDRSQQLASQNRSQWIEVYVNGADLLEDDEVKLIFHRNERVDRIGQALPATDDNAGYVVTDRLSTIDRFGNVWALKGQSGATVASGEGTARVEPTDLVSMYRKVALTDTGAYKTKDKDAKINGVETGLQDLGDGSAEGSWEKTATRANMTGRFVGTPGSAHITFGGTAGVVKGFGKNPASFSATGVIINEVRNDPSDANLDWVELYHYNDAAGATPQTLENWTLSIVTAKDKDTNLFSLPKIKLQPGEYLVVYNRHPGETILAGGVNVEDVLEGKQVNKGASHLYIVRDGLNLPATGKFLLLLRNGNDKVATHEKLVDYAGNGFFSRVEANKFNTDVWPFIGWTVPADVDNADFGGDNTFASANQSFGRNVTLTDKGMYRPNSGGNRVHKDHWQSFGFMGTGYDREVDPRSAPGTPGYENRVVNVISDDREGATGKTAYNFGGTVTISEIMYDAGPRWNLVQWIELYNSSMTETVNLDGWTMEIRNESTDVESYVDSSFKFEPNTEILPNQTLLIVSGTGANDVPQERVYDLFEHHRQQLGLTARDSRLLSREGFYIRLTSKIMQDGREKDIDDLTEAEINLILMDEVGNVAVDGAARVHEWDLPPRDSAARQSLVRVYGTQEIDGTPDMASDGLMMGSWKQSDISGAALTFYGHRNDISTPGYRLGGPLPVQLSSFRPVRDKATSEVTIRWITQSELNNAGFNILRSEARVGPYTVVNVKGIIPGHGTTSEKHVYEWKDTTAKPNVVYYYQIEDVSLDGKRTRLATTHLRGNVAAGGKLTTTWGDLKSSK